MIFGTQLVLHEYHHGILNRTFSQETIQDVHIYLDCLNFNCLVGNSNETHLLTLKVLRANCLIANFKPQTKAFCYYKPKTKHSFFDNHQRVCGSLKIYSVF